MAILSPRAEPGGHLGVIPFSYSYYENFYHILSILYPKYMKNAHIYLFLQWHVPGFGPPLLFLIYCDWPLHLYFSFYFFPSTVHVPDRSQIIKECREDKIIPLLDIFSSFTLPLEWNLNSSRSTRPCVTWLWPCSQLTSTFSLNTVLQPTGPPKNLPAPGPWHSPLFLHKPLYYWFLLNSEDSDSVSSDGLFRIGYLI